MLNNKPLLLGIILLLAGLRFIIVPWMDYQDEQKQQLETLTKRLVRSEALVEFRTELTEQKQLQDTAVTRLLADLQQSPSTEQYQLEFQQQMQQLLESNNVSLLLFDWLSDTDLKAFNAHRARVSLRFEGTIADIVKTHLLLEQKYPSLLIRDLNTSWRGGLSKESRVAVTMMLESDYRVEAP
jgi:hypothetical protein